MSTWMATTDFLSGLVVLAVTGRSVLGTAVAPRGRPSRLVFATVPVLIRGSQCISRRLPSKRIHRAVLRTVSPIALLFPPLMWASGTVVGMALLAASVGAAPAGIRAMPYVLGQLDDPRWTGHGFPLAVYGCLILIFIVLATRITAVASAYQRRERFLWALASEARSCLDAEDVIVAHMHGGTPDSLDRMMSTWQLWIADLRFSHTSYPELLTLPSSPDLSWLDATLVILDVAALMDALSPGTKPPPTRPLLVAGCAFVQAMAKDLQVSAVRSTPSLYGREERSFRTTIARLADAGIHAERDYRTARATFQRWRSRYAPYTAALADLMCAQDGLPVSELMPIAPFESFVSNLDISAEELSQAFAPLAR
ncbi:MULTISPECIES: hypothetical protein [unclassified Frankia]|uniref:hypothetical protein n=1 Tax=unclassified Frankia TaxID=2632575 RepID=UPI002AD4F980|nr:MULTISPECIES: hypothetical protein [unclassified Frankia]